MFTSIVFTAVLASSAAILAQADVSPNEPAPGDSFNEGAQCSIAWDGDSSGSDIWKNMSIELMTGSNNPMTHLTTVATGQDGSVAGTFSYTCPQVTPNSPIYFYQFSSCTASNMTWTGRFSIAGTDGSTTPATQTAQFDGQPISFGTGALADPSSATAAPTCSGSANGTSSSGSSAVSGAAIYPSASSAHTVGATAPAVSPSLTKSAVSAPTSASSNSNSNGSAAVGAAQPSGSSAALAVGPLAVDTRMWPVVAALTASAMAFTILL